MYIKSLCLFCNYNSEGPDLKKSMLIGLISSKDDVDYNHKKGFVIAFNSHILSYIIHKSRNFLSNHLSNANFLEKISKEIIYDIISQNVLFKSQANQIFSMTEILVKNGIKTDFYFLRKKYIKHFVSQEINNLLSTLSSKFKTESIKKYPNNAKYLEKNREKLKLVKELHSYKAKTLNLQRQLDIFFNQHFTVDKYQSNSNCFENYNLLKQKVHDLFFHKPKSFWNENVLKATFLIKYCSESAYNRLWTLSKNLLPPPTTIESHYEKMIQKVHQYLTDSSQITYLLDSYWESNKHLILVNSSQESFEINCCLSCDAASLINFDAKYEKVEDEDEEEEEEEYIEEEEKSEMKLLCERQKLLNKRQKLLSERKKLLNEKKFIINQILNGSNDVLEFQNNEIISDEEAKFFFAFLLQPFDWRLPVMVIHLSKSLTGHQTLNEFYIIKNILTLINKHQHFSAHFFAADGELALNKLHREVFNRYKILIPQVIQGKLTINDFIKKVYDLSCIIAVLDMLHGVKSGRNKVMSNGVKLGDGCDVFNYESLSKDLKIKGNTLKDKSTAGRMKDMFALILFVIKNA